MLSSNCIERLLTGKPHSRRKHTGSVFLAAIHFSLLSIATKKVVHYESIYKHL